MPLLVAVAVSLGAVLVVLVAPPHGFWALHHVLFVPVLLHQLLGRWRVVSAIGFPVVMLASYGAWLVPSIQAYGELPPAVSAGLYAVLVLLTATPLVLVFGSPRWLRTRFGTSWPVAFALLYAGVEHALDQVALFPTTLAVAQLEVVSVRQVVSVFGAAGVTALVALTNASAVETVLAWRERRDPVRQLMLLVTVWTVVLAGGSLRVRRVQQAVAAAPVHRVGVIQTDLGARARLERPDALAEHFHSRTRILGGQGADLVIWPEGASVGNPGRPEEPRPASRTLQRISRRYDLDLVVGSSSRRRALGSPVTEQEALGTYNSASLFTGGAFSQIHDKARPMPFAEYLPLADWQPTWLRDLGERYTGRYAAGEGVTVLDGKLRYGVAICYEAFSAGHMARLRDADLLVVVANDAWYGDTRAPHLAAALARLRALESGRTVVRSGLTGITALITPDGEVREAFGPFASASAVWEVPVVRIPTIHAMFSTPQRPLVNSRTASANRSGWSNIGQ